MAIPSRPSEAMTTGHIHGPSRRYERVWFTASRPRDTAAHKRETIAWAKRRQASIEKLAIFQVWRNYIKRRREKGTCVTPAMLIGLATRPWRLRDLLRERLFFERTTLSARWRQYYRRDVRTASLAVNRIHDLTYAF